MNQNATKTLLSGNHAVSHAVKLARPQVIPVYPITPQTPILEKLTDFHAKGELDANILTPESEHSAMAACITASLSGVRVFTATASQGLLLMHEMLHYASGARAPIVMFNVNRTIGSPWGFWPDQTDSLAQRDTGWVQFYTESGQESLDLLIQAYKIAERVMLPVMINHEAFYVSHALESVEIPSQSIVDQFLPDFNPEHMLDPDIGESWGNVVNQEMFCRHRHDIGTAMEQVVEITNETGQEWTELTGRPQGVLEEYRCDQADIVIVTMGSMSGNVREAVDTIRESGLPIGLLKVRLFRPLPADAIRKVLLKFSKILVLDRNYSPGVGGFLHQEIRALMYGLDKTPDIFGYLAGVGGLNVSPGNIESIVDEIKNSKPSAKSVWVR